jgi:hypothetical protein
MLPSEEEDASPVLKPVRRPPTQLPLALGSFASLAAGHNGDGVGMVDDV